LYESIIKKPLEAHQKSLILEVTAEDTTEEDVEIPYVLVKLNDKA
jgi:ubiquitin-activating enzyme E1